MKRPRITQETEEVMQRKRYEENMPVEKIAEEFAVSRPTVYTHTNRESRKPSSKYIGHKVVSIRDTEILWGGGIIEGRDESK